MTAAEIARKMVSYSNGNRHDINRFMKVYAFAKTIGECDWTALRKQFWRLPPSSTISPVPSAGRNTETLMESIRSRKAPPWSGASWQILASLKTPWTGSPGWWAIITPSRASTAWTIKF